MTKYDNYVDSIHEATVVYEFKSLEEMAHTLMDQMEKIKYHPHNLMLLKAVNKMYMAYMQAIDPARRRRWPSRKTRLLRVELPWVMDIEIMKL